MDSQELQIIKQAVREEIEEHEQPHLKDTAKETLGDYIQELFFEVFKDQPVAVVRIVLEMTFTYCITHIFSSIILVAFSCGTVIVIIEMKRAELNLVGRFLDVLVDRCVHINWS
jgi:hypothetical protein